jgi:hypothetical protein
VGRDYRWVLLDEDVKILNPKSFMELVEKHKFGEILHYSTHYVDIDLTNAKKEWTFNGFSANQRDEWIPRFPPYDEEIQEFLTELSKTIDECEFIVLAEDFPYDENAIWRVVLNKGKIKVIPLMLCERKGED